jgi:hypothetical protein
MTNVRFSENYYSFRSTVPLLANDGQNQTAQQAALSSIESTLVEANNDFTSRQDQRAIAAYKAAEAQIYSLLDPGYPPLTVYGGLSRDPGLFDSLLSVSLEWMNILLVRQSFAAVRPRVAANPALLNNAAQFDQAGLLGSQLSSTSATSSLADWQLAKAQTRSWPTFRASPTT